MFDKIFKNNFEQEQTIYDLKFNNTLKQFIVINRDSNNCHDEAIISGSYKSQLLKITDGLNNWLSNWLSKQIIISNKHYFVVTGKYPNLAISEKLYIYRDSYKYCLEDIDVKRIDLYESNMVFKTYEDANNKVIELLQQKDFDKQALSVVCGPMAITYGNNVISDKKSKFKKGK